MDIYRALPRDLQGEVDGFLRALYQQEMAIVLCQLQAQIQKAPHHKSLVSIYYNESAPHHCPRARRGANAPSAL